ncbi:MAG TPA: hypothetical protein VEC11_04120 [Allosphingosinicella sp.]|nr:hypothetical protein [Allosphingosinicella sp.]
MNARSLVALLLGAAGAASCATPRVMAVTTGGMGTGAAPCFAEVEGRRVPLAEFGAFARRWRGREAQLKADINTPYRCVGPIIFELQRTGFRRIGFTAEPAPAPEPAD